MRYVHPTPEHKVVTLAIDRNLANKISYRSCGEGRFDGHLVSRLPIDQGFCLYGGQPGDVPGRLDGKQRALTEVFDTRIANQERASRSLVQNQETYLGEIVGANERRAQGLTAAEMAGAKQAVAVAKGGVDQGCWLDLQANRITYDSAVKAAAQARDASFEAARLRALSTVVSAIGYNVTRDTKQGLALRY